MTALLAFVCFVIATVIFLLLALDISGEAAWGFVFVAGGLAIMCLGGAYAWGTSHRPG